MRDDARPRSAWLLTRRVRLFVILGGLSLLVAFASLDLWNGRRIRAAVTGLEARYGSLDNRSAVATPVASTNNQARFVRAAAALVVPSSRDPERNVVTGAMAKVESQSQVREVSDVVRTFAASNVEALRLIGEARHRSQSSWDADYAGGGGVPGWMDVRMLSHAALAGAVVALETGQADEAAERVAAGVTVAASIRHEPSLIAQLVRIAVTLQQCHAIEQLVSMAEPSQRALEELARALEASREPDPLRVGLLAELRHGNAAFARLEEGDAAQVNQEAVVWLGPLARIGRPFVRQARLQYLRAMERLIEVQASPRPRNSLLTPASGPWQRVRAGLDVIPGLERAMSTGDLFHNALAVAQVGVALRRYRLNQGSYPEGLAALVPTYLGESPTDAITGQPLSYARSGTGFTLRADWFDGSGPVPSTLVWEISK